MAKKNFHQSNEKLLDEQCKYLFRMANEMKDEEHQFNFVHGHVCAVEEGMKEGEQKKKIVKSMASWALKEFNAKEKYKVDLRMLDFWKLLGKYSNDLKMEGVMENLHRVGHFNAQPAFYLTWAEHWASLNNRRNFDKIVTMCETNCSISSFECAELFKPLTSKYFGEVSEETDTMALIKEIADRPEKVRRTLTMFPAKIQEQQQTLPASHEQFSIFQDQAKSMLCVDADDVTVSGAHGKFTHTVSTSTPRRSVAFCAFEPPMMEMDNDELLGPSTPGPDNERGLFAPLTSESKLQRRLSLGKKVSTNEGGLKIAPVILEETEEFSKEF